MVKLQKMARGNYVVAIPKSYVEALGWADNEKFALCPGDNGVLRIMPLFKRGGDNAA